MPTIIRSTPKIAQAANAEFTRLEQQYGSCVSVSIYGFDHYSSRTSLAFSSPGVSVAVLKHPGEELGFGGGGGILPNYVYYEDTRRMVKLDSDKARAEFIGKTLEGYRKVAGGFPQVTEDGKLFLPGKGLISLPVIDQQSISPPTDIADGTWHVPLPTGHAAKPKVSDKSAPASPPR